MVKLLVSTVIDAPVAAVWAILRDFIGHHHWHPAVDDSWQEGQTEGLAVGAVRAFRLKGGEILREQLLSYSEHQHSFRYGILSAPWPLMGYVADVKLHDVTEGQRCFWQWGSSFQPPKSREAELVALVRDGIYRAGFAAVAAQLAAKPVPRPLIQPPRPAPMLAPALAPNPPAALPPSDRDSIKTKAMLLDPAQPGQLRLATIALPPPQPHEVRLRHLTIGVNRIDLHMRDGQIRPPAPPHVPGMEAVAVIEALGAALNRSDWQLGQRVAYVSLTGGAYAERRNLAADRLLALPETLSDATVAASLMKGITAAILLREVAQIRPGMSVLITGAGGPTGQLMTEWAADLGARVTALTSSAATANSLRRLQGVTPQICPKPDQADWLLQRGASDGFDVIFDGIGGSLAQASLRALRPLGHLVSYGQIAGPAGTFAFEQLAALSLTVTRPNIAHYIDTAARLRAQAEPVLQRLRSGQFQPPPPQLINLSAADTALDLLARGGATGPLVLLP